MTKTVVILGAGWAGLPLAHKLLKYTSPKIDLEVILVSPNSHFFWNVAATRGIIPGEIPDDQLFIPIVAQFKEHPSGKFEFMLGTAESVLPEKDTVHIKLSDGTSQDVVYDQLVVATGSRLAGDVPLKSIGSHEHTMAAWEDLKTDIDKAKTILVSGAGPTGAEVAGELAARYGSSKSIRLVSSQGKLLGDQDGILDSVRDIAEKDLQKLGVKIIKNTRVASATTDKASDKRITVTLSDGNTISADCHIPLHGIKLNTSFMPAQYLTADGSIKQSDIMQVDGLKNVWAIGDAGILEPKQLTVIDNQIVHLAASLDKILTGSGEPDAYKPVGKTMIFVSLGKKFATGQIGSWRLWGFMVAYVKGRKLFVDTAEGYVGGQHLRHGKM
jgi:NADH dehydrogenase FAD-containing subunit